MHSVTSVCQFTLSNLGAWLAECRKRQLRIFFTKSKYPTFRQETSMHHQVGSQGWFHKKCYTHIEGLQMTNPYNLTLRLVHEYILVNGWWSNNLTQLTKNDFVKNILKPRAITSLWTQYLKSNDPTLSVGAVHKICRLFFCPELEWTNISCANKEKSPPLNIV